MGGEGAKRFPDRLNFLPDRLTRRSALAEPLVERDLAVMHEALNQLRTTALRHVTAPLCDTAMPGLKLSSTTLPTKPVSTIYQPMICFVLQGAKQVAIGDQLLRYDTASYFIASVEVAASGCVIEASAAEPYLAFSLAIDPSMLAALITELPDSSERATAGFAVSKVTPALLETCARLLALLDAPSDIPVLAPMLQRELLYRLLLGEQGEVLRQIARADSRLSQIQRAMAWIRRHYDSPLRIEALAEMAGMSRASFHRHFKAATAMSPLQYQKAFRLQEARRLLSQGDAQRAAYSVGYESASQFSREYTRMFGLPPRRDAERLRSAEPLAV